MGFGSAGDMTKAVYDPDEDDRIEKGALEIALDKLLKGAGAGADPTEIEVPGLVYTEIAPAYTEPGTGWLDWDLSGSIPAGAKYAEIVCIGSVNNEVIGVRENGSAVARTVQLLYVTGGQATLQVELPTSRIIETYYDTGAARFYCVGYWS